MKKLLSLLLSIAIILVTTPFSVFTVSAYTSDGYDDSGSCGANVRWSFNESSQTLTISGTGNMKDYYLDDYVNGRPKYDPISHRIKHLVIEDGVTSIGDEAFGNLIFLQDVVIPSSLTGIGADAFESIYLKRIYNYSRLKFDIGAISFGGIARYATFIGNYYKVSGTCGTNATWSLDSRYRVLYINGSGSMSDGCYSKWTSYSDDIDAIIIQNGITTIGNEAFKNCTSVSSVTIPNTVYSIGSEAFSNMTWLDSISIPDSVVLIGAGAFSGCTALSSIILPEKLGVIANYTFNDCTDLEAIIIPNTVKEIGENAFYGCNSLTTVSLSSNLKKIGNNAFYNCENLTEFTIPTEVTYIGSDAFKYCNRLKQVDITSIENWCNIDFENQCSNPLYYSKKILLNGNTVTSLVFPETISEIKSYSFIGCVDLVDVEFHTGIASIGDYAFAKCSNISEVTLSNELVDIGEKAFDKSVVIFGYTGSASEKYAVQSGNVFYSRNDTVNELISWNYDQGVLYINGLNDMPNYNLFTSTPWYEIKDYIKSVEIDERITSVGTYSFFGCDNLVAIATDNKNLAFKQYALNKNSSLTFYGYPGGVLETYCVDNQFNFVEHLSKPNIIEITPDTIIVEASTEWLYSLDKTNWTNNNVFVNLNECTNYTVYIRRVEGLTPMAIRSSEGTVVTTLPYPTPNMPVLSKITADTIKVVKVQGLEYSLDKEIWNETGKFTGLKCLTSYRVYARPITDIVAAQKISEPLAVTTPDYPTPDSPTLNTVTDTSISINTMSGFEYSLDKINWTTTGKFTGLSPAQSYSVYVRPVTTISEAQKVSAPLVVTTLKSSVIAPQAPVIESYNDGTVVIKSTNGYEYSSDGITWQTSSVFENIDYDTFYYFYQRVAETDTQYVSQSSPFTKIIIPSAPTVDFVGATTLSIDAKDGYEYSLDKVYWQTSGDFEKLITDLEYTVYCRPVYQTSLFQTISEGVTVTVNGKDRSVSPSVPTLISITDTTVTLTFVEGYEYSKNGNVWQSSNVFENLDSLTKYEFYQRVAATATNAASKPSEALIVITDKPVANKPSAPTLLSCDDTSVALVAVSGYEYSNDGLVWQTSNIFAGLSPATQYNFYQRVAETSTAYASVSSNALSVMTDKATPTKPSTPTLSSKTDTTITLTYVAGYEYKMDNGGWQLSNVFANLEAETNYTFYQRSAETTTCYASETSDALTVKTDAEPVYTIVFKNWDGTVLSTKTYHYGDKVTVPTNPTKAADSAYTYTFAGWDKLVVNCAGNTTYIATYTPNYIDYAVVFKNYDGAVLSSKTYHYGDTVIEPNTPAKPEDDEYTYTFAGWDSSVVACNGNKTYTATFNSIKKYVVGDIDGVEGVTDRDAVYLLYHTFLSDIYPVNQDCDFNSDGEVNDKDAVYLLYYTFLPDLYPIA